MFFIKTSSISMTISPNPKSQPRSPNPTIFISYVYQIEAFFKEKQPPQPRKNGSPGGVPVPGQVGGSGKEEQKDVEDVSTKNSLYIHVHHHSRFIHIHILYNIHILYIHHHHHHHHLHHHHLTHQPQLEFRPFIPKKIKPRLGCKKSVWLMGPTEEGKMAD